MSFIYRSRLTAYHGRFLAAILYSYRTADLEMSPKMNALFTFQGNVMSCIYHSFGTIAGMYITCLVDGLNDSSKLALAIFYIQ